MDSLSVSESRVLSLRPFIIRQSLNIRRDSIVVDSSFYAINHRYGQILLDSTYFQIGDLLTLRYKVLPLVIRDEYYRRRIKPFNPDSAFLGGVVEEYLASLEVEEFSLFGDSKLERSGSITRGFTAGNSRDVSLQSGMRIQLAGEVSEGVNLKAVLSDEDTPIQPEGTTQRLREFDKVFMQLESSQGSATLGDYDLRFSNTDYAPFRRKQTGIALQGNLPDIPGSFIGDGSVVVAGAASKGIFQAQTLVALDGVQGPYRLEGKEGERFIIVIAGTERIYIDGELLIRGESNDYIIDYAQGEIHFSSKRLVTQEMRINVEFEYTTNRFTRTLLGSQATLNLWQRSDGSERATFRTTVLREADSRAFSAELGLTAADDSLLQFAGDSIPQRPGEERVEFDPEANYVQYVRADTMMAGQQVEIFLPLSDTTDVSEVYRVNFSRVTTGTGSYIRVGRKVNGVVFEWVGDGGNYLPVRVLPKPKLQQLVDFRADIEPIKGLQFYGEFAQSTNDLNRVSDIDSEDDLGIALVGGAKILPVDLAYGDFNIARFSAELKTNSRDRYFESFDRTRDVEYSRKWNLGTSFSATGPITDAQESETSFSTRMEFTERSHLNAEIGRLSLGDIFNGSRLGIGFETREARLPETIYKLDLIDSKDNFGQSIDGRWFRQKLRMNRSLMGGRVIPNFEFESENRSQKLLDGNDVGNFSPLSLTFTEIRPGVTVDFSSWSLTGSYELRSDQGVIEGELLDRSTSNTLSIETDIKPHRNLSTNATLGYRNRQFSDRYRIDQNEKDGASLAFRWTSRFTPFKRSIQADWRYEALTEKTPTLQETYIRTGTEFGEFVWVDANEDGILQIDEFIRETTPLEGSYIRSFVPSDELQSVINVQSRFRFTLDPRRLWKSDSDGLRRLLSFVWTQSLFDFQVKSSEQEISKIYVPDYFAILGDSTTVNGRLRLEQRVELFKGIPDYGVRLFVSRIESANNLAAGREGRENSRARIELEFKPSSKYGFKLLTERSVNASESNFASRVFRITANTFNPEFWINYKKQLQISLGISYSDKDNSSLASETKGARLIKLPLQLRYNRNTKMQISGRFETSDIVVEGDDPFGQAAFELTDGRGAGRSYLWNLQGQYLISQMVRASLLYDGRSPQDAPTIHNVRMQVSLIF